MIEKNIKSISLTILVISILGSTSNTQAMLKSLARSCVQTMAKSPKQNPKIQTKERYKSFLKDSSFHTKEAFNLFELGQTEKAKEHIRKHLIEPKSKNKYGETILHLFCKKTNDVKFVEELLENGFVQVLNDEDKTGNTPVSYAIRKEDLTILKRLLDKAILINKTNYCNKSPLYFAVEANDPVAVKLLLEKGATINELESPLILACSLGKLEIMEIILAHWPKKINTPCSDYTIGKFYPDDVYAGRTLLWVACANGETKIVEFLLDNGAKINNKETLDELLDITCDQRFCRSHGKMLRSRSVITNLLVLHFEKTRTSTDG